MKIEVVGKALRYTWPGGEVLLEPGKPVELSDERATRLLKKAGSRVRQVLAPIQSGDQITWTRADGTICVGLVDFIHVEALLTRWAFVSLGESWAAVNLERVQRVKT